MTSYCWHLDDRQRCLTKYSFVGSLFTSGALWARGPYCRVACGVDRKAPFALTQDPSLSPPCPCSVQSPKEMLSDGVNSETSGDQGHFRGCRIFHGISASHFTSAGPITGCPYSCVCLLIVSASSKHGFTSARYGRPLPSAHHSPALSTRHDRSVSGLVADASAFQLPRFHPRDRARPRCEA